MNLMKSLGKFGILIACWLVIFYVLTFITQLTLAPWDTAVERPAIGTWQRTLNDFFESAPGHFAISAPLTLACIILSAVTLRRNQAALNRLLLIHLTFAPILLAMWMGAVVVNNAVYPYPPVLYDPNYHGYYRSVIPMAAVVVTCAIWLYGQLRLAKLSRPAMLIG